MWLRDTAANRSAGSVLKAERLACEDPCNIDRDLRRQCQDVNKLEMQETNRIYLCVPRC